LTDADVSSIGLGGPPAEFVVDEGAEAEWRGEDVMAGNLYSLHQLIRPDASILPDPIPEFPVELVLAAVVALAPDSVLLIPVLEAEVLAPRVSEGMVLDVDGIAGAAADVELSSLLLRGGGEGVDSGREENRSSRSRSRKSE
jgi:hypothetical protein